MSEQLVRAVSALCELIENKRMEESALLSEDKQIMLDLVATDDWLPEAMAKPHPQYYQQHLLYGDPKDRFSLVSFVWGPGQKTPIHDHTVWGVIAMLRGAEKEQAFEIENGDIRKVGEETTLNRGEACCVSPTIGDIHRVRNCFEDQVSISIHLYGGNIGRISRNVYDPETGNRKAFISGYSNEFVPNLWASKVNT